MNDQFNGDEDALARLVREAGDPSVAPDPRYAEKLRAGILDRLGPAQKAVDEADAIGEADVSSNNITLERTRKMKRIAKFIVAATILLAAGVLVSWIAIDGGSGSMAFAEVAKALDGIRCVTFDITSEAKGENDQSVTATGRGFFLAPSRQRVEMNTGPGKGTAGMITISDSQAAKNIVLMPEQKVAMVMDVRKMQEKTRTSAQDAPTDLFETARRLVREGNTGTGGKIERLGKKEIDGRAAVGFRTHNAMSDMTLWADSETARPIRIEIVGEMWADVRVVMDNFRYDLALDPSLFSLEPPEGYSTQTMDMSMPTEKDLLRSLRTVAENNERMFPAELGMNKEVMESLTALLKPEMEKLEKKYGFESKSGEKPPVEMMAEVMKTMMPRFQKEMQGIMFYVTLKPENDSHYIGGGVKLDTPDRPILRYKPTGAEDYRVIYADLSVKEMTPEEVKRLPEAEGESE